MLRYHNIYWDLKRSTEILQDLLISHGLLVWQNTFDVWHWHVSIIVNMTWHDILHLLRSHTISTEISQDLLRYHKNYWEIKRSTDLAIYIWHFTCHEIAWHLTLLWHDIWHLTFDMTDDTGSSSTDTYDIGIILS